MEPTPKPTLNEDQKAAFRAIRDFLNHPVANTFVLKGYAGTGKTFLMQLLGKWLEKKELKFCMLASTGRAAAVLRGKTGFTTKTVHGELYHFSKVDGIDESMLVSGKPANNGQMSLQFATRVPDQDKILYIVDEASMLSGDFADTAFFATFGSGVLLNDFFEVVGKNKVIFVGDPCQLPPVGQGFSPALDVRWLNGNGRNAVSVTLKMIERTEATNDILKLAGAVRKMADYETFMGRPKLPALNLKNVVLHTSEQSLFAHYSNAYRNAGTNETLAIAKSNKKVQQINRAMRRDRFGIMDMPLQPGDVLLVTQNNYAVPLSNGDFVEILQLGELKYVGLLKFQDVRVKSLASEKEYNLLLSLDILHGTTGNFSNEQSKSLMIDFSHRMRSENIKPNSSRYKEEMLKDEFLNCLRATYGYAVTCHKAQGGEWAEVYLFLDNKMYGMPPNELCKWWYTAITRARVTLHLEKGWWVS
ncbi:DEAD/DEAH box helicase [Mucilaginibacter sp.]|uniref:ATP-dependent DNA helicase n=1 Tax=Mucilaginibacter sp. TaxID=1882438 RepID=UPI002840A37F|nr:DEAD/DEAH box helicase [Mucilaginibacter sp.]MDR3695151.1 DEAD/DEAH box helicase [Mucilaginibacter sp.]